MSSKDHSSTKSPTLVFRAGHHSVMCLTISSYPPGPCGSKCDGGDVEKLCFLAPGRPALIIKTLPGPSLHECTLMAVPAGALTAAHCVSSALMSEGHRSKVWG